MSSICPSPQSLQTNGKAFDALKIKEHFTKQPDVAKMFILSLWRRIVGRIGSQKILFLALYMPLYPFVPEILADDDLRQFVLAPYQLMIFGRSPKSLRR